MREIKFRAWLRNVGIMLNVYVLDQTGNAGKGTHFERSKGYGEHGGQFVFNIDGADLMQWTGLKDKNEVEIYDGDIVQTPAGLSVIEFDKGMFGLNHDYGTDNKTMLGSWGTKTNLRGLHDGYNDQYIYQHKELLNQ